MTINMADVTLLLSGNNPIFPDKCVVCGHECKDEFVTLTASAAEASRLSSVFSVRQFKVTAHQGHCSNKLMFIWSIWRRGVVGSVIIGAVLGIISAALTENMYIVMGTGLGVPMLGYLVAFISRDLSPISIFELHDGVSHKFCFQKAWYAHEFQALNRRFVEG